MKKIVNGVIYELTQEEIAELEALAHDAPTPPTAEERLEAIEAAVLEMLGVTTND